MPAHANPDGHSATLAPAAAGSTLAVFPRRRPGLVQELRVSLEAFEGRPFVSLRVWERDRGGRWWPCRGQGLSVRVGEAGGVAAALARAAEDLAAGEAGPPDREPEHRRRELQPSLFGPAEDARI